MRLEISLQPSVTWGCGEGWCHPAVSSNSSRIWTITSPSISHVQLLFQTSASQRIGYSKQKTSHRGCHSNVRVSLAQFVTGLALPD